MEGLFELILKICDIFSFFPSNSKNASKEYLPSMPGEQYILLTILLIFTGIFFLLYFVVTIDVKLYVTIAALLVVPLTLLFFWITRKIYFSFLIKKMKR